MNFIERHKKLFITLSLLCFLFIAASAFPIYNFNKEYSRYITLSNIGTNLFWAFYLGSVEEDAFPKLCAKRILLLNLGLVLLSLLARYLIEFGEVSNLYNFTLPNILLHVAATVTVSTLSWLWMKRRNTSKN